MVYLLDALAYPTHHRHGHTVADGFITWSVRAVGGGFKRFNEIYDSTGTQSLRILAAGMMSGMTSPARPWFKLAIEDADLMQYQPVKLWLDQTTKLMHTIFQRSNTYRALHAMYEELGAFGTAASIILPDFDDVLHHYPLTVGEYTVATNWKGEVDTLYREFQKTVAETVREFGYDNCSPSLRRRYDNANYDGWVTIIHAIEPRLERDASRRDALNMPWRSVYLEKGAGENDILRESGFRRFPALCPRWTVSGGDIYGHSPGMEALGDIKQLQHEQLRKAQGIDYKTNPPLQVPTSLKYRDVDRLPGGIMYTDSAGSQAGIRPLYEVQLDLNHLLQDIQDVRGRMPGKDGKPVLAPLAPSHLHQWNGKEWMLDKAAASQLLAEAIDQGTDAINNLVDKAYRHVTRFQPEYLLREQQARDYKAGGCKGEAPLQVAAFAKPAGKTACEATDIIIAQADNLRMVMGKLGALRMRKFELKGLKTAAEVDKRTAEILAEIKPIADKLGEVGK